MKIIMKNLLLITATIFFIQLCNAQTSTIDYFGQTTPGDSWSLIGPDNVKVFDYVDGFLCTEHALLIDSAGVWVEYPTDLPVRSAMYLNADSLLLILGNDSESDGIYIFEPANRQLSLVQYTFLPRFLHFEPLEATYYVGTDLGCFNSKDGVKWNEIQLFSGKDCFSMASYQGNYVISTSDGIYFHSLVSSQMFEKSEENAELADLASDASGNYFGIWPGGSWSSGLWVSSDLGITWSNEFYSQNMSAVYYGGRLFVGWESTFIDYRGVAMWDTEERKLHFLNDGLPNAAVNKFSTNRIINALNVICCTDSGAYMTYNFNPTAVENSGAQFQPLAYMLDQNYPNPFNPSTVISYQLAKANSVRLTIYNVLGQKIKTLVNGFQSTGEHSIVWDATDERNNPVSSGIYFYCLHTDKTTLQKKMMLIR